MSDIIKIAILLIETVIGQMNINILGVSWLILFGGKSYQTIVEQKDTHWVNHTRNEHINAEVELMVIP